MIFPVGADARTLPGSQFVTVVRDGASSPSGSAERMRMQHLVTDPESARIEGGPANVRRDEPQGAGQPRTSDWTPQASRWPTKLSIGECSWPSRVRSLRSPLRALDRHCALPTERPWVGRPDQAGPHGGPAQ